MAKEIVGDITKGKWYNEVAAYFIGLPLCEKGICRRGRTNMQKRRRVLSLVFTLLLAFTLVLTGCGGGGATSEPNNGEIFFKGYVDACYKDTISEEFKNLNKDQAAVEDLYVNQLMYEIDYFISEYAPVEDSPYPDATVGLAYDLFEKIYRDIKYEIVSSKETTDGYDVTVKVSCLTNVFNFYYEEYDNFKLTFDNKYAQEVSLCESEEAYVDLFFEKMFEKMQPYLTKLEYDPPETIVVKVLKDGPDHYLIDEESFAEFYVSAICT